MPQPARLGKNSGELPSWRWEELRTTLWVIPSLLILLAVVLFAVTFSIDLAAFHHHLTLPFWIRTGSATVVPQVLIAIAAAVITVIGVVFSITILALTLASQQFGPRMLRNFVRDIGNQVTLGVFVGTFVYSVLALGSISADAHKEFIPHLSASVAEALLLVDVAVLIYFIHHIAKSIQLPEVIAGIAADLMHSIDAEFPLPVGVRGWTTATCRRPGSPSPICSCCSRSEAPRFLRRSAATSSTSATRSSFPSRPGRTRSSVWSTARGTSSQPGGHWPRCGRAARRPRWGARCRGRMSPAPTARLQDPVFAIDQLVEIGIRAISAAVNDTFTALTCIDWLGAGLGRVSGRVLEEGAFRDSRGVVRLIELDPSYARMVNRAFDKLRQSAAGNPAVLIRLMDSIGSVMLDTTAEWQRTELRRQAEMVMRLSEATVNEPNDLDDVRFRFERLPDESAFAEKPHAWSKVELP